MRKQYQSTNIYLQQVSRQRSAPISIVIRERGREGRRGHAHQRRIGHHLPHGLLRLADLVVEVRVEKQIGQLRVRRERVLRIGRNGLCERGK